MIIMFLSSKNIIDQLRQSNRKAVLWGLSEKTKTIITKYRLQNILCIIDINAASITKTFGTIPIKEISYIDQLNNIDLYIWGNHTAEIFDSTTIKHTYNCYIDFNDYIKQTKRITLAIELPKYPKFETDLNIVFGRQLVQILLSYYFPLQVNYVPYTIENQTAPRQVSKNELLFSYHSIGSTNSQIMRWKESYLNNLITFDTNGYSGWSSICHQDIMNLIASISEQEAIATFDTIAKSHIKNNLSKYDQPKYSTFKFPEKFIFFPLQVIDDSVMKLSYFEPISLIKKIVTILSEKKIPLLIKKHPRCESKKITELLHKYEDERKILIYNGSIHDAIAKAQTIYVINSGVGFEALLHLKPVTTFGKSDYMMCTRTVMDLDVIEKEPYYHLEKSKKLKIKKFLHYYINNKSCFLKDKEKLKSIIDQFMLNYLNQHHNMGV